jgi:SAM-dependent methyltransferase
VLKSCLLALSLLIVAGNILGQHPLDEVDIHAPFVPTAHPVVDAMLKLAHTKKTDVVYDLGCGDGRIVIAAAKRYGTHGVGIDINPERIREANANARREGVQDLVRFEERNVYDADLREATIVMLYMLPEINLKLQPKLRRELKPGARIVSHAFDMGSWKPSKRKDLEGERIFLWKIPRRFWPFRSGSAV